MKKSISKSKSLLGQVRPCPMESKVDYTEHNDSWLDLIMELNSIGMLQTAQEKLIQLNHGNPTVEDVAGSVEAHPYLQTLLPLTLMLQQQCPEMFAETQRISSSLLLFQTAQELEADNNNTKALELFSEALQAWPAHVEAALYYGLLLKRLGYIQDAERAWQKGLESASQLGVSGRWPARRVLQAQIHHARAILYNLAILWCLYAKPQRADQALRSLGLHWKLHPHIWRPPLQSSTAHITKSSSCSSFSSPQYQEQPRKKQKLNVNTSRTDGRTSPEEEASSGLSLATGHVNHKLIPNSSAFSSSPLDANKYFRIIDHVLPLSLINDLKHRVFHFSSPFWRAHGYFTHPKFFSYNYELSSPAGNIVEQLVDLLLPVVVGQFPEAAQAVQAEWWVHSRDRDGAHQLHFDTDEHTLNNPANKSPNNNPLNLKTTSQQAQQAQQKEQRSIHPIVSCVLYLTEAQLDSGPTLVTTQTLGMTPTSAADSDDDEKQHNTQRGDGYDTTSGWLSSPALNRLLMFDGMYVCMYVYKLYWNNPSLMTPHGCRLFYII